MNDLILYFVITNGGDGSNGTMWTMDEAVLDKMEELASDGDETFASGDGLQVTKLHFPATFDLTAWLKVNHIKLTTLTETEEW